MTNSKIRVITTINELRKLRQQYNIADETLGFVPTMGYLHDGHLSLISKSLAENDHTIISIFVNPSQFAPGEDLDSYPRDLEHDLQVLSTLDKSIDAVFCPTVTEMYPTGITLDVTQQRGAFVSVLGVSEQLEGKTRPNFFRGVATVVTKLFNAVRPDTAYFGQKDIQQTVVIRKMVEDLLMGINIKIVETKRAESGLALSSRNKYLDEDIKRQSVAIYKGLSLSKELYLNGETDVKKLQNTIVDSIKNANDKFKIDYVSFNDPETLDYLDQVDKSKGCIVSLAVYVPNSNIEEKGTTRLIDNMIFNPTI
ncbi:pantoate--beta-alanine ligase [Martiniozyma asiatica (nom. inval.)]|nr:pantoate--beta-alanine ligase [Martiniozyma asiatica]